jgi:hypothetical protein
MPFPTRRSTIPYGGRVRNLEPGGCTGMSDYDTHAQLLDVDEAWLAEWACEGLAAIETYLAKHAAFAEYLSRRTDLDCDDGDCPADA